MLTQQIRKFCQVSPGPLLLSACGPENKARVQLVSFPDIHVHRQRTSGRLSYVSCHRGVASVGVIEALIALRNLKIKRTLLQCILFVVQPNLQALSDVP